LKITLHRFCSTWYFELERMPLVPAPNRNLLIDVPEGSNFVNDEIVPELRVPSPTGNFLCYYAWEIAQLAEAHVDPHIRLIAAGSTIGGGQ
jgi:hypothetical protein